MGVAEDHDGHVDVAADGTSHPAHGLARVDRLTRSYGAVVALNDVTTPEALAYIDHRLERLGVHRLLARAGAEEGDVVWIGEFSFEYRPDL